METTVISLGVYTQNVLQQQKQIIEEMMSKKKFHDVTHRASCVNGGNSCGPVHFQPRSLRPRPHRAHTSAAQRKKWKILHYLHSAAQLVASAALYVNTQTDNSGFHLLHCIMQTLRCALRTPCARGVKRGRRDVRAVVVVTRAFDSVRAVPDVNCFSVSHLVQRLDVLFVIVIVTCSGITCKTDQQVHANAAQAVGSEMDVSPNAHVQVQFSFRCEIKLIKVK